jgi:hypothetical protein
MFLALCSLIKNQSILNRTKEQGTKSKDKQILVLCSLFLVLGSLIKHQSIFNGNIEQGTKSKDKQIRVPCSLFFYQILKYSK